MSKRINKIKEIALKVAVEEGEFYIELFRGLHRASIGTNYRFNLVSVKNVKEPLTEVIKTINSYDAACVFLPGFTEEDYKELKEGCASRPIVSLAPIPSPVIDTITFDSYSGGNIIAAHFFKSGFNDVGIIHGSPHLPESNYRKNGFIDFVNSKSSMNLLWEFNGDYSIESGKRAFNDYLKNANKKKIAIFSCNDAMSVGFVTQAHSAGVKIPEDLQIAGYDNIPMCENTNPPLSSIATNFQEIGHQAISYLERKFANGNDDFFKGHLHLVPVNLVERLSTRK